MTWECYNESSIDTLPDGQMVRLPMRHRSEKIFPNIDQARFLSKRDGKYLFVAEDTRRVNSDRSDETPDIWMISVDREALSPGNNGAIKVNPSSRAFTFRRYSANHKLYGAQRRRWEHGIEI